MILFLIAAAAASPAAAETPSRFIQRIYAAYSDENYNPLKRPDRIFAPELLAAIREDERLAKGEVGYLNADPICDCQDFVKIGAQIRSLKLPTKRNAVATVHVTYGTGEAQDLRLKLVLTRLGWRVADIGSHEEPSLLGALHRANREARSNH